MKVVVNDANIIIDLIKLELLPQFFSLGLNCFTTDLIFAELHDNQQKELAVFIATNQIEIIELSTAELIEIVDLEIEKPQLSPQDCSAIVCAKKIFGDILTSDNNLRKFAQTKKLQVRGHLWIFDRLFENKIIDGYTATTKLETLIKVVNPRLGLPSLECEKRKEYWAKTN